MGLARDSASELTIPEDLFVAIDEAVQARKYLDHNRANWEVHFRYAGWYFTPCLEGSIGSYSLWERDYRENIAQLADVVMEHMHYSVRDREDSILVLKDEYEIPLHPRTYHLRIIPSFKQVMGADNPPVVVTNSPPSRIVLVRRGIGLNASDRDRFLTDMEPPSLSDMDDFLSDVIAAIGQRMPGAVRTVQEAQSK